MLSVPVAKRVIYNYEVAYWHEPVRVADCRQLPHGAVYCEVAVTESKNTTLYLRDVVKPIEDGIRIVPGKTAMEVTVLE